MIADDGATVESDGAHAARRNSKNDGTGAGGRTRTGTALSRRGILSVLRESHHTDPSSDSDLAASSVLKSVLEARKISPPLSRGLFAEARARRPMEAPLARNALCGKVGIISAYSAEIMPVILRSNLAAVPE